MGVLCSFIGLAHSGCSVEIEVVPSAEATSLRFPAPGALWEARRTAHGEDSLPSLCSEVPCTRTP